MKSEDVLTWFPAQIPAVRRILGDAVLAVVKQGRPVNTRTLCDYIYSRQQQQGWMDKKEPLQTALNVLEGNQKLHGKI